MNCTACQEQLAQMLDGTEPGDRNGLDEHLRGCADCRAYDDAARRLRAGLKLLRPAEPPADLGARLVRAVQEQQRQLRRRARRRLVIGLAVAASVLVVVAIRYWPDKTTQTPNVPEVVKKPEPTPPVDDQANVTPRQSVKAAVDAVAFLTSDTTSRTVEETKRLIPLVEPTLPPMSWEPAIPMPTLALREAGHGVGEGLEPVATHAKKAVGLLRREFIRTE